MSKKIKKQIKRSMPWFVIMCFIVSTSMFGLVFNLDFQIIKEANKSLKLDVSLPAEANADTASTTVTVTNAAPILSGNVAESPAHASTTPVNVGYQAVWQATANDAESNDYYLIVCGTDSVSATNGGAPTCGGGAGETFCVSSAASSTVQATCTDAALADPGAETDVWYAFVCDNHATEADCSTANQGSGDSGSPIYINHAPSFTAVVTSDDNKDPGGTFTVTASTTDTDTQGGSDEVYLYVCQNNSWATSTGCVGGNWCVGTSTVDNVSCSFATTTPALAGPFSYYTFIKDWHEMPATANSRTGSYHVNNVAPSVSNVIINGGVNINVNLKNSSDYVASTTATLYDANSCLDISGATSSIFISSSTLAVGGLNCSANGNYCYQITSLSCHVNGPACGGSQSTSVNYICTTTISHYTSPTDASAGNPYSSDDWLAGMTAIDSSGAKGASTSPSSVELISLVGLDVNEDEIPYGSIRGGQNSGNANATTTVINYGNTPIDSDIDGTDMDKTDLSDVIFALNQEFDLANFAYGGGTYTLSSTSAQTIDIATPKPTSTSNVSDQIFWGIAIPGGTTSGDYEGTNTFIAALDSSDW